MFSTEVKYWQLLLSPHTKHSQPIPIISSRPESIKEMTFASSCVPVPLSELKAFIGEVEQETGFKIQCDLTSE